MTEEFFKDPFANVVDRRRPPVEMLDGHLPGELGIWVLILFEMCIFAVFFGVFVVMRSDHPAEWAAGRDQLSLARGVANTVFLLTGSLFVVLGVNLARRQRTKLAQRMLIGALICALLFVGNKVFEWTTLINHHHGPGSEDFFMYFFMFTGIHLAHLIIGSVGLTFMIAVTRKPVVNRRDMRNLEVAASYWHMVDLLWIVLFALLYLLR